MAWTDISVVAVALAALCAWLVVVQLRRGRTSKRRFEVLAEIAAISERADSLEQTFEAICDLLVPELADLCIIDMIEESEARRVAVRVGPGGRAEIERGLAERAPSVPSSMLSDEGASLSPRFYERMGEEELREIAHGEADLDFLRGLGVRSGITVALQARGQVRGALTLAVAWSGRRYSRDDLRFAWVLSGRVALTLDNSGLFADLERAERARAEIAETLQRGLLPAPLPHIPGWSLAALYRPAGDENEVGGDFYDAFQVPDGWMVVVGDVTGRGAYAASITALARYTLRTAAMLTNDPVVALATLNRALLGREDTALCSIVAITLSEDPRRPVRIAVAGHPPPLLVDGERVDAAAESDPLLGAFDDVGWRIHESSVEVGQHLVTVTDGVLEAAHGGERFGETRLRSGLAGVGSTAAAVLQAGEALDSFTAGALEDDVAMLALSRTAGRQDLAEAMGRIDGMAPADGDEALVRRLFNAFNQRDEGEIATLCSPEMEFFPVTAEAIGRANPYVGPDGLHDYLDDVERFWEELLITPSRVERRDDWLLVEGRVFLRNREIGIRDMPAAWIWRLRGGLVVRGEVFADPERASMSFARTTA